MTSNTTINTLVRIIFAMWVVTGLLVASWFCTLAVQGGDPSQHFLGRFFEIKTEAHWRGFAVFLDILCFVWGVLLPLDFLRIWEKKRKEKKQPDPAR